MTTRRTRLMTAGWLAVMAPATMFAQAPAPASSVLVSAPVAASAPATPYPWRGREAEIEAFLREAPITHFKDIPVGITKPRRAYFAPGGAASSMAWKPLSPGLLHGKMESYKSEIAAYLLSRHLGLDLVPPVVERDIKGRKGAAIYWIDGVRPWNPSEPPVAVGPKWSRQTSQMMMFDLLIANIDRNQGNLLLDDAGNLHLIDHSRAFTTQPGLGTLKAPRQFDRALWAQMDALTHESLQSILRPWLDRMQIDALLKRRDAMRRLIERQVQERGDTVVFLPAPQAPTNS